MSELVDILEQGAHSYPLAAGDRAVKGKEESAERGSYFLSDFALLLLTGASFF